MAVFLFGSPGISVFPVQAIIGEMLEGLSTSGG
jgi:hypothetical protein